LFKLLEQSRCREVKFHRRFPPVRFVAFSDMALVIELAVG